VSGTSAARRKDETRAAQPKPWGVSFWWIVGGKMRALAHTRAMSGAASRFPSFHYFDISGNVVDRDGWSRYFDDRRKVLS
jgi:hypothetical protein